MTDTDVHRRAEAEPAQETGWVGRAAGAFRTPAGLLAVLVIAAQAVWRGGAVMAGYFTQDDFVLLRRAAEAPLDLDHLFSAYAGEISPLGQLMIWMTTSAAPMDWGTAALVVVVLQALAAALLWLVLTRILDNRWVRLPLLAVACFAPLTLASTMWWSLAMMHLPTVVLLLVAVLALLGHLQDDWEIGTGVAAVALVLALFGSSHTLLLPLVPFVVVATMLPEEVQTGRKAPRLTIGARLAAAIRAYPRLWAFLVAAAVARVLLASATSGSPLGWPSGGTAGDVMEQYARQGLTGLVGGPWSGDVMSTVLVPAENWPLGVAVLLCLLLAVPVLRSSHPVARVATLGLVTYFAGGAVLLVVTQEGVGVLGTASRFLADLVTVAVVLLACALRKVSIPPEVDRFVGRAPAGAAALLVVAYVVSAGFTTSELLPALKNSDDREWVAAVEEGLDAQPQVVLLDGPVPEGIMTGLFGGDARVSTVTALLPQAPTFDVPSEFLRVVDGLGLLREIDLLEPVSARIPSGDCGQAVASKPTRFKMKEPVGDGTQVMQIGYFLGGGTFALIDLPQGQQRIPVRDGVHEIEVPVHQGFDEFSMSLESLDQTLCVTSVEVGAPIAAPLPGQ